MSRDDLYLIIDGDSFDNFKKISDSVQQRVNLIYNLCYISCSETEINEIWYRKKLIDNIPEEHSDVCQTEVVQDGGDYDVL